MNRRPGIGGLKRTVEAKKNFQNVGEQLEAVQMEHMSRSLAAFRTNLESFARAHKHEINANPAFRRQFQIMCTQVGVDPLASHKGFWSDLLGLGDFYYELSVQIIEICLLTRDTNGGIISVEEMVQRLRKKRGTRAQEISEDDIIQSLKRVSSLGGGYRLIRIGSRQMIASKPMELNTDHMSILEQAQGTGYCTISSIRSSLGWSDTRCETVLNWMLQEGMIWIDTQSEAGETQYWFPSLFAQIQANQAGSATT